MPAWDKGAGRGHEGVEGRYLRPVEVEEQIVAGPLDQNRAAAVEILLANAVCHESHEQLPAGLPIDLMARALQLKARRQKVGHIGVAERPDMEPHAEVVRIELRTARVMRGQGRGHHSVEKIGGAPPRAHTLRIDEQGHGDLTKGVSWGDTGTFFRQAL